MAQRLVIELMTAHPRTLDVAASVADALQVLEEAHCHHVPVVHRGVLVGMLSERDLLVRMPPPRAGGDQGAYAKQSIHSLMAREPSTVKPWEPASNAVAIIMGEGVSAVPVVDDMGLIVGIVTISDVARLCLELLLDEDPAQGGEARAKAAADEVVVMLSSDGTPFAR